MKLPLLLALLILLPTQALAQRSLVAEVKKQLETEGVNLLGPCGAFEITKRVAWAKRHEGYGLLGGKGPANNGCVLGDDKYSVDWILKPNGEGVDLLINAGGNPFDPAEPTNVPDWDEGEADPSLFRTAINPFTNSPDPNPQPQPIPVPTPEPTPTPDPVDLTPVTDRLDKLEGKLDEHIRSTEEFQSSVGSEWRAVKKFFKEKGLYILGAVLGGKYLLPDGK